MTSQVQTIHALANQVASRAQVAADAPARERLLNSDPIDTANQALEDLDQALIYSFWDWLEDALARWGVCLVALASFAVFMYVALAYFGVIPVVQR